MSKKQHDDCRPGCRVILLSKDERRRAEGALGRMVPTEKAKNGLQRYDIHIRGLREVGYAEEPLGRTGVAVR